MNALRYLPVILASVLAAGVAWTEVEDEALRLQALESFSPLPAEPVFKPDNPGTATKIKLGKKLYFDTRLSKSNVISCNSCHNLASAGVDNNPVSIGHGWAKGARNAPTVLNVSLHIAQFWDGRASDVEEQAIFPILNDVEMASTPQLVVARLKSIPEYRALFLRSFPDDERPVSFDNTAAAIGAFERTLLTPSRFDNFLKGDDKALNEKEKTGLRVFMKSKCDICHNGVGVGGGFFQKFGVFSRPGWVKDKGLYEVTGLEKDKYVFKVPSLRNVAATYPYFHNGSVWDLQEAIRIMARSQLATELSDTEVENIEAFLKSLNGGLPAIVIPELPSSTIITPPPILD